MIPSADDGGRSCIPLRDSPGFSPGSLSASRSRIRRRRHGLRGSSRPARRTNCIPEYSHVLVRTGNAETTVTTQPGRYNRSVGLYLPVRVAFWSERVVGCAGQEWRKPLPVRSLGSGSRPRNSDRMRSHASRRAHTGSSVSCCMLVRNGVGNMTVSICSSRPLNRRAPHDVGASSLPILRYSSARLQRRIRPSSGPLAVCSPMHR